MCAESCRDDIIIADFKTSPPAPLLGGEGRFD